MAILLSVLFVANSYSAITFDTDYPLTYMVFYDNSGTSWTARSTLSGDYFDDNSAVDDCVYFIWRYGFWHDLLVNIGNPLVADTITVAWEYWDGDSWEALPGLTDDTNAFQNGGACLVYFDVPDDWIYSLNLGSVASYDGGIIRCRITAVTNISEGGSNSTPSIKVHDYSINVTSTGNRLSDIVTADTSGSWGCMTQTDSYYLCECNLLIGGAADGELFVRDDEVLQLGRDDQRRLFRSERLGNNFQLGYKTGDLITEGATFIYWNNVGSTAIYNWVYSVTMYGATWWRDQGSYNDIGFYGNMEIEDSLMAGDTTWYFSNSTAAGSTWTNSKIMMGVGAASGLLYVYTSNLAIDGLDILAGRPALTLLQYYNTTMDKVTFRTAQKWYCTGGYIRKCRNCVFTDSYAITTIVTGTVGSTGSVVYTMSLDVVDSTGTAIATPYVVLVDAQGQELFNGAWSVDLDVEVSKDHYDGAYKTTVYTPLELWVYKDGFNTSYTKFTLDVDNREVTIALTQSPTAGRNTGGSDMR